MQPLKRIANSTGQSKAPLHLRDNLETFFGKKLKAGIILELNEHANLNSWFIISIITLPKNYYKKLVIDARYTNSIKDTISSSWSLERLQVLMKRLNCAYFTRSNLACAYHQAPLTEKTQKHTSFIVCGRQDTYHSGFYYLKLLSNFFSK